MRRRVVLNFTHFPLRLSWMWKLPPAMKYLLSFFVFALLAPAQPVIGQIEIYGRRKVSEDRILKVLAAKPGEPLPKSKGDVEDRLVDEVGGVLRARLEAFCCEQGKPILYVGIEERGAPAFEYRTVTEQEVDLPDEIVNAYDDFTLALNRAALDGETGESLAAGHSLMQNLACRLIQERFIGLAQLHEEQLRKVLASAADPDQRAVAAYVIGYAPDKKTVVNDLQQAVRDPEDAVRLNAARALKAIALYGADPKHGVTVRATWFVEMLNSVALHDRLEAAQALLTAFAPLSEQTTLQIRERALDSLNEMARWRHLPHALPAFLLLGRVAGIADADLEKSWTEGARDETLKRIAKTLKK